MTTIEAPTLYELKEATRDDGLVGEEKNVLTFYLGTVNGSYLLFDGPSSSGKDQTIHSALFLLDDPDKIEENESDLVHYWSNSSSAKAPFYNSEKLNQRDIHIIPDRVAVNPDFEMIVKALSEGRPATHEKVDVTKSDAHGPGGQMEDMTIEVPRCLAMSIATDNEKIDMKELSELDTRAFTLTPDASEEQTRKINKRQVEMRDGTYERRVNEDRLTEIRQYYRNIPIEKYTQSSAGKILNLAMDGIQQQEPLPPKFVKARRDLPRLMDFIEAVALYHHTERMEVKSDYPNKLLAAPKDGWFGFKIFGEELVMSALNLKPLSRKLLEFMRARPNEKHSVMELQQRMQEPQYGENRSTAEIRTAVENMQHKMYVERHDDNPIKFSASPFGQSIDVAEQAKLDWEKVVTETKKKARENLDGDTADEYIRRFCEGEGLIVTHPVTGETLNILEDNEFEEKLDDAQEQQDEVFDQDLWGSDDDTDADADKEVAADGGEDSGTLM